MSGWKGMPAGIVVVSQHDRDIHRPDANNEASSERCYGCCRQQDDPNEQRSKGIDVDDPGSQPHASTLRIAATFWKGGTTFRPSPDHLPSVAKAPSEIADTFQIAEAAGRWSASSLCSQPRFIPKQSTSTWSKAVAAKRLPNDFRATSVFTEGVWRASCERSAGV